MKLSSLLLIAAGAQANDAYAVNMNVTKTRVSRLFINFNTVGELADQVDDYNIIVQEASSGRTVRTRVSGKGDNRQIQGLRPNTKYNITLRATGDFGEGSEQTFSAYTSPRGIDNAWVSYRDQNGARLEWDPVPGADQYKVVNTDSGEVVYAFGNSHYANMISGATENFEIYSVACGMDCASPPNAAEGKPLNMQATSVPPSPLNVRLSDLEVNDVDYANAEITWTAPLMGAWDSVKVEYSPNTPPALYTKSPSYFSGEDSASINGLYQNTIYTFTVRFVSNNIEGPAESYTYAINDYSVNQEKGTKPTGQTCRVPTYLRPENLRVRREFIGGQRMEISWDHPKAQQPENGYRLVFAPFADVIDQKPWIEVVDGNTNTFTVDGHNYDPMDEYTVSVIALHDSYQGNNSPDYIASHFTGVAEKTQRNTVFVAPDACCGALRHNSKDSSCCGGNLITDDSLCCTNVPYSPDVFQCCGNGRLTPVNGQC